jgi:transcriptional regulator with XRE-family HTH domain
MILKIKDIAKEKGVTIKSLADSVGITQPNMSNIVNEKTTPSIPTLQNIADTLGVHITDLFEKPDSNPSIKCPNCGKDIFLEVRK